ncbi:MAG: hypothetical protein CTY31_11790 [Hyphomicrobium sp.]|nr:MAG: hypothetical protein CTY31_11790 [Hyphomicrobium sp.]
MTTTDRKEVTITNGARDVLDIALKNYEQRMVDAIRDEKFVPGEAITEINASDVEKIVQRMHIVQERSFYAKKFREIIVTAYLYIGIALVCGGLFYTQLREIYQNEPARMVLVLAGATMVFVALIAGNLIELRSSMRRRRDDE